ncbi:hypothetical protein GWI33_011267 [Rhynchophorus ferrugineus]|uniref:Uncharacterized protein n=1 Tax=Rhynchophorus ferrugineus TaxID=354439 RepID=A0A834I7A0_RHYFE|nr:hypothetical protein GWI33_011267 [Rhynchophorus ferrugineus]
MEDCDFNVKSSHDVFSFGSAHGTGRTFPARERARALKSPIAAAASPSPGGSVTAKRRNKQTYCQKNNMETKSHYVSVSFLPPSPALTWGSDESPRKTDPGDTRATRIPPLVVTPKSPWPSRALNVMAIFRSTYDCGYRFGRLLTTLTTI